MWSRESQDAQQGLLRTREPRKINCWGLRGHTIEPPLELAQNVTREKSFWGPGRSSQQETQETRPTEVVGRCLGLGGPVHKWGSLCGLGHVARGDPDSPRPRSLHCEMVNPIYPFGRHIRSGFTNVVLEHGTGGTEQTHPSGGGWAAEGGVG